MTSPARRYSIDGRIGKLVVRGKDLQADLAEAINRAALTLSIAQVDSLTLDLSDTNDEILASRLFDAGASLDYADLLMQVYSIESSAPSELPALTVKAEDVGSYKLRGQTGLLARSNSSPDAAVRELALEHGLQVVAQDFPAVPTLIVRAAGSKPEDPTESSYAGLMRMAREVGAICFVSRGTVYFGRPSWLVQNLPRVPIAWAGKQTDPGVLTRPKMSRSIHALPRAASLDVELDVGLAETMPPGCAIELTGIPTFEGLYLTESLGYDLGGTTAAVKAATPVDPVPEPPDADDDSSSSPAASSGHKSAGEFVTIALNQAGDRYVYGAETRPSDADPNAFDCSELVQWALARVGVTFVDGSSAQIAACRSITVEQGIRTRGALLWLPGHIAISLGNGRTIEARGRKYGVTEASASGRFSRAGLIPSLRY